MKIAVITGKEKDKNFTCTRNVCQRLIRLDARVLVPEQNREGLGLNSVVYLPYEQVYEQAELIVTIGGDGTILHAARDALARQTPVLGVNTGRIGFMAGMEVDELDSLRRLVSGDFDIDSRMMLDIHISGMEQTYCALNDAVISKGTISKIIDLKMECNGTQVTNYRADGLIVATPTGSTAYSMSAGGPVIDPRLDCISVTPISPHSLISRTLLFEPDSHICVYPQNLYHRNAYLTVDGLSIITLESGMNVQISKSRQKTRLVRLKDVSFYNVLYSKMNERGL